MLFLSCRRKLRHKQNLISLLALVIFLLFSALIVSHLFCCSLIKEEKIRYMCKLYRNKKYSGSLCEELCSESSPFVNFNCEYRMPVLFTAEKNGDVVEFRRANKVLNDLAWRDKEGKLIYPKIDDFHHIVKMHILVNYNVTLEENMIKLLINQEIDENNSAQMLNFWRLFKDNNYLMSKLFDDDGLFPTIMGACGPYYVVEHLTRPQFRNILTQFFLDSPAEQMLFKKLFDYVLRLDMVRPDPLKICKIDLSHFGSTPDLRFKALNSDYIQIESQVNRRLASGKACARNEDCDWQQCRGSCDKQKHICNGSQQNDNLAVLCDYVINNLHHFPELRVRPALGVLQLYEERCLQARSEDRNKS